MKLFKKPDSKFWWYDFKLPGVPRQRASTKETNQKRAEGIASVKYAQALEGRIPIARRKVPTLAGQWETYKMSTLYTRLDLDTQRYYANGWRMVKEFAVARMRVSEIRGIDVTGLPIPGSPSNVNCVRRTVRRLLNVAETAGIIAKCPRIPLLEENERTAILDEAAEQALMPHSPQPLKDIIVLMRELGMRNARELYCMVIERIDWTSRNYNVPASKTSAGIRSVPLTERTLEILRRRCDDRKTGWVFPSVRKGKHITSGLVNKQWVKARTAAGLSEDLVLYTGRHDYGTYLTEETGNLKAVMMVMGHRDYKTALRYQRPRLEPIRDALNKRGKKTAVLEIVARSRAQ